MQNCDYSFTLQVDYWRDVINCCMCFAYGCIKLAADISC